MPSHAKKETKKKLSFEAVRAVYLTRLHVYCGSQSDDLMCRLIGCLGFGELWDETHLSGPLADISQ